MTGEIVDVAVIGAGLAGLICAQQLYQAGYQVVVLEKSRGVGGRLATRRIAGTRADLGAPYLEAEGRLSSLFFQMLHDRQVIESWTETVWQWQEATEPQPEPPKPRYTAPTGSNAVGKCLATNLEIWFDRRVCAIAPTVDGLWHLSLDAPRDSSEKPLEIKAHGIVMAIPAPQAIPILAPLGDVSSELLEQLRSVDYDPSLAVIAGYSTANGEQFSEIDRPWRALRFPNHDQLRWLGLDSSKRIHPCDPIFVLHSSPQFAQHYLESTDLEVPGTELLKLAASLLLPALATPEFLQVHRWRYAFPRRVCHQDCLMVHLPLPLVCCGDWCGESTAVLGSPQVEQVANPLGETRIETALRSGLAAASGINTQLQQLPLAPMVDLLSFVDGC